MCRLPVTFGGGMTTQNGSRRRPLGASGAERARLFPERGDPAFDRGEVERFVHHGILFRAPAERLF